MALFLETRRLWLPSTGRGLVCCPNSTDSLRQIYIDTPLAISEDLLNIPFLPNAGTLTSEPGYPFSLQATFIHGSDYLRRDQDGQHVRLEVTSTARDNESGSLVRFSYNGIVDMRGDEGKVIRGDNNATTTGFGNACELHQPQRLLIICADL